MKPALHMVYVEEGGHPGSRPLFPCCLSLPLGSVRLQGPLPPWKMLMSWLSLLSAFLFPLPFPPTPKMENLENQT